MNEPFETIDYRGYDIKIYQDEPHESPDDWGDDYAFIVYDHRDFYVERDGFDPKEIFFRWKEGFKTFDGYWIFPLYAYIHGGVALSLSRSFYPFTCSWDTSFTGFALVRREKGSWNEDEAYEVAEEVVKTWNCYLMGEVFGYVVEEVTERFNSCWGYYGYKKGDWDYMIWCAEQTIDYDIQEKSRKHFTQLKSWINKKVPFEYRHGLAF